MSADTFVVLAICFASIALADDFKTINGKEYKNAKVSRVEPDGIVLITKWGISKIYFAELPKEVQVQFGHDPAKIEAERAKRIEEEQAAERERAEKQKAAERDRAEKEKNAQADSNRSLSTQAQLDAPQFEDLRRRDWYEDLKKQSQLKNQAEFKLAWIADRQKGRCRKSAELCAILKSEMEAHRKNYETYAKLKGQEQAIISQIATQIVSDHNDVMQLEMHVSSRDAEILQLEQQYFSLDLR